MNPLEIFKRHFGYLEIGKEEHIANAMQEYAELYQQHCNKAENLPISGVTPRFCFICGSGLKDVGHNWLQCESEECAEMFRTHKDAKGNQHVMMFRTPFTPK